MEVLLTTNLPNLYYRGKVRDTYDLGDALLLVATDRISAFDVVLPTGIPYKGAVLTQLSAFWFQKMASLMPNHFISVLGQDCRVVAADGRIMSFPTELAGRAMVVRKAQRVDLECVVRGYLAGSAWAEYQKEGTVCGMPLPKGLRESEKLPEPIFTPATKAESGHDINISVDQAKAMFGADLVAQLIDKSLALYNYADEYARQRGIIIADTKFEFGLVDGQLILIDELLTPDSSRLWPSDGYAPGRSQPSFDKQYVRDWLNAAGWNHEPPAPELPPEVVAKTSEKYLEAYRRLTGRELPPMS